MKIPAGFENVSPCGINCEMCSAFMVKDKPELMPILVAHGLKEELLPCPGCRAVDGNCRHLGSRCEQYACTTIHDVVMCYECEDYPCRRLIPAADRANTLPHNLKMISQVYIQKHGVEAWKAKLPELRQRYFTGKISYGKGPLLEGEE